MDRPRFIFTSAIAGNHFPTTSPSGDDPAFQVAFFALNDARAAVSDFGMSVEPCMSEDEVERLCKYLLFDYNQVTTLLQARPVSSVNNDHLVLVHNRKPEGFDFLLFRPLRPVQGRVVG